MKLNKFESDFFSQYLPNVNDEISIIEETIKGRKLYIAEPHEIDGQFSGTQEMYKRQMADLGAQLVYLKQLANKLAKHTYETNL